MRLRALIRRGVSLLFAAGAMGVAAQASPSAIPPLLPIGLVQGEVRDDASAVNHVSPWVDQPVTLRGVVTQRLIRHGRGDRIEHGFFVQNPVATADGDPQTSDGIFIYTQGRDSVEGQAGDSYQPRIGDELILTGRIREVMQMTQLTGPRLVDVVRRGVDPDRELASISLPAFASLEEAHLFWERNEGMRLSVPGGSIAVSGRHVYGEARDAEVWVVPPDHILARRAAPFARRVFRDPHPLDDIPETRFDNANPMMLVVGSLGIKGLHQDPWALIPAVRTFSTLVTTQPAAVVQRYETYSLQPPRFPEVRDGPDPARNGAPPDADPARRFCLATFNVENLYDHRDDPEDPSDAPRDPGTTRVTPPFNYLPVSEATYRTKLNALARMVVDALQAPDLILLQEIEDQDLDHDGILDVLADLIAAIRATGGPAYRAAVDRAGVDYRGILSAFLYQPHRLALDEPSPLDPVLGEDPSLPYRGIPTSANLGTRNPKALNATLPEDVNLGAGMASTNVFSRPVQVARFRWVGHPDTPPLVVLNNHFASRPDQRVGQRIEQTRYNAAVAEAVRTADPETWLVAGGDLNVFPRPDDPLPNSPTDQLGALYAAGLVNLYDTMLAENPAQAYTYVYRGQAQTLDHLFVSTNLAARLDFVAAPHINSDWPRAATADPPRGASDHDPVLAGFRWPCPNPPAAETSPTPGCSGPEK